MKTPFQTLVFLALICGMTVLLSPPAATSAGPIKLGFAGPLSGEFASYGIPAVRGVRLAVRDINTRGGIRGRPIHLMTEDDLCLPKDSAIRATKLVAHGVHAVVGHICSGATMAAIEIYRNSKIISISPSATHPGLTQKGRYPNFFRTIAPDDVQAGVLIDFALNDLALKRIAILHGMDVYGKGLAGFVRAGLQKSGKAEIVLYDGIPPGTVDYAPVIQRIKHSRADAVIFGGYHPQGSRVVKQMRKKKMNAVFIAGDGIKDDAFIVSAGDDGEGTYATAPKETTENPLAAAATAAHRKEYGTDPGAFFLNAHAATLAITNAIQVAGTTDYDALRRALQTEPVDTPLGKITFDARGDARGKDLGFSVYRVKNGVFIKVK